MATIKIKAIIPKNDIFDIKQFEVEAAKSLNKIRDRAKTEFEKTTATWREKPAFRGAKATPKNLNAKMWGNTQKWIWVVRGTDPHPIVAKNAPTLKYKKGGFTSKTIPRKITSRRGSNTGQWRSPKRVQHPGTKPRDFDIVIAEKLKPVLVKEVRKAIKRTTS